MAAYSPPAPVDTNPFDPEVVDGGFVDLATAINDNIDDTNNLSTKSKLTYRAFTPEALTTTRAQGSTETGTLSVWFHDSGAGSAALKDAVYGERTNIYTPAHASASAYLLHGTPDVHVSANVTYHLAIDSWIADETGLTISEINYECDATLYALDSAGTQTTVCRVSRHHRVASPGGSPQRLGIGIPLQGTISNVPAGLFSAWVELDFSSSDITHTGSAALTYPQSTQFRSTIRQVVILASYQ